MLLPSFSAAIKRAAPIRPALNLGPGWDIMSGEYVEGVHGEMILNGGMFPFTGVAGGTNSFKTGILAHWMSRVLHRYVNSNSVFYDAEETFVRSRFYRLYDRVSAVQGAGEQLEHEGRFNMFDRSAMTGDQWFETTVKEYSDMKVEHKGAMGTTPFRNLDGTPYKYPHPTANFADSLTEMRFRLVDARFEDNDIGASESNTRDMRISNAKRVLIEDIPMYTNRGGIYVTMTAQVGKEISIDGKPQKKKTTFMKQGEKLDKCPPAFYRLPNITWIIETGAPVLAGDNKSWMYPSPYGKDSFVGDDGKNNPDLMEYSVRPLRSKGNGAGVAWSFIASQREGYLPGLTAYHFCKSTNYFGLPGNNTTHECAFLPGKKFGRTTVRELLNKEPKLERALEFLMDMAVMQLYWYERDPKYNIDPVDLYNTLKDKGYDWDVILTQTRSWWTYEEDKHPLNFLSTMDLLRMYTGEYHPYWMAPLAK